MTHLYDIINPDQRVWGRWFRARGTGSTFVGNLVAHVVSRM